MTQMKKKRVDLGLNKNALEPLKTRVPEAKEFRKYFCSLKGNKWNMKRVLRCVSHIHTAVFKMDNPQGFSGGSAVKNPPADAGDRRRGSVLGGEDPLEEEMAAHSRVIAWKIPRTEEPGGLRATVSQSRT